jgi:acetyl-CoA carboxylase biotin carboxyl carrier protein
VPLDFNELRQLLLAISETDITELTLKSDDFELTVRQAEKVKYQLLPTVESGISSMAGQNLHSPPPATSTVATNTEIAYSRGTDTPSGASVPLPTALAPPVEQKSVAISSPMVGTFYRSPAPGEPPFVEVGDRVRVGQTVCIIEAMKLMNEIEAEVSGQILEILVQNGEPIEYGQPLMRIYPD